MKWEKDYFTISTWEGNSGSVVEIIIIIIIISDMYWRYFTNLHEKRYNGCLKKSKALNEILREGRTQVLWFKHHTPKCSEQNDDRSKTNHDGSKTNQWKTWVTMSVPTTLTYLRASQGSWLKVRCETIAFQTCAGCCLFGSLLLSFPPFGVQTI